ncbi:hypothetical protein PS627_03334 [Pseudomonas fluorescens]|uniref:hypothetical protein n=1 Tax=Pseudomonas fluorescens TaxID=294 RepID=UPI0012542B69|nr:hypothetical protein [Pseudomonas fluorescens]CAG8869017.1 hypothetical protein PS627_03334 [Pseudomonas fluorescens]VVP71192.1 hypothetical protein PS910_00812 [Pseudomonas fluorescens]
MNRQNVNTTQITTLPLRQVLFLTLALMLTLVAGQLYHSWQTARLADQVAAQTALLAQIQSTRASTLVQAADRLPETNAAPATLNTVVPQERWVF